jgi:hypothetical protein
MIWQLAIPIDFQPPPLTLKPYNYINQCFPPRIHRPLPKTSQINQESRHETLKHFQRLQLKISLPDLPGHREWSLRDLQQKLEKNHYLCADEKEYRELEFLCQEMLDEKEDRRKCLKQEQKRAVWWDKTIDVLKLDFWALNADVRDIVSYLGLQPFVESTTETVSSVRNLEIDMRNGVISEAGELFEEKMAVFVALREVMFVFNFANRRSIMSLVGRLDKRLKELACANEGYPVPEVFLVWEDQTDKTGRKFGRRKWNLRKGIPA